MTLLESSPMSMSQAGEALGVYERPCNQTTSELNSHWEDVPSKPECPLQILLLLRQLVHQRRGLASFCLSDARLKPTSSAGVIIVWTHAKLCGRFHQRLSSCDLLLHVKKEPSGTFRGENEIPEFRYSFMCICGFLSLEI